MITGCQRHKYLPSTSLWGQWLNILLVSKFSDKNPYKGGNKPISRYLDIELKLEFLSELKDQIKKEVSEDIKTGIEKREELESKVSLLQEHVKIFQKQVNILECKNEDLEQYGREVLFKKRRCPVCRK